MELGERGDGALGFAGWLFRASQSQHEFEGIHVLDRARLSQVLRDTHLREVESAAQDAAHSLVRYAGAESAISGLSIAVENSVEGGLAKFARQPNVAGLILGRLAPRDSRRLVRLGRVARRTLRNLPAPTIVVPPDLGAGEVGDGPVLLAVDPGVSMPSAAAFARRFATEIGRPLAIIHVVETFQHITEDFAPAVVTAAHYSKMRQRREEAIANWKTRHEMDTMPHHVVEGHVVDGLCEVGENMRSPLIVSGSRQLGLGMRIFDSSVSSALAAASMVPVAVVPEGSPA
ncbi:MAG: universal stress protein [Myxococcota bacterium]